MALEWIPVRGFISTRNGPLEVDGLAFQIPGFEFMHTWVTPLIDEELFLDYTVSQWETGLRIGGHGRTEREAAVSAERLLRKKGIAVCAIVLDGALNG